MRCQALTWQRSPSAPIWVCLWISLCLELTRRQQSQDENRAALLACTVGLFTLSYTHQGLCQGMRLRASACMQACQQACLCHSLL